MDVSVHSFLRLIRKSERLMPPGSSAMTVTFHGSEKVVSHYNIMGPVKAALESTTRYVAAELGQKAFPSMPCRPAHWLHELQAASPALTRCWQTQPNAHPPEHSPISKTLAHTPPFLPVMKPETSLV